MTSTPLPPDDELVSAYLDGEASDDERARVEGDPVLVARVAELRAAAAAVAAPVDPLDEVTRRRLIDAALAAGAPVAAAGSVAPPAAPVVELATRRRRPAAWVGAAAAAVTAIVLVSVLPGGGDGDVALRDDGVTVLEAAPESAEDAAPGAMMAEGSDEADTGAPESDAAVADDADDDAEEATGGDGGDDSATESPDGGAVGDEATMAAPVYLGTLPDVDAVVERARSLARDAAATPPVEAVCPVPARTEALVLDATAQVAGVTYLVRVWSDGTAADGTAGGDIEVVDATDCALVLSVER